MQHPLGQGLTLYAYFVYHGHIPVGDRLPPFERQGGCAFDFKPGWCRLVAFACKNMPYLNVLQPSLAWLSGPHDRLLTPLGVHRASAQLFLVTTGASTLEGAEQPRLREAACDAFQQERPRVGRGICIQLGPGLRELRRSTGILACAAY